jgi:hypothetical protein
MASSGALTSNAAERRHLERELAVSIDAAPAAQTL